MQFKCTSTHINLLRPNSAQTILDQFGPFHQSLAARFAKQLFLGNGKIAIDEITNSIRLPSDFCKLTQNVEELINCVFPNLERNYRNHEWRLLLALSNADVESTNSSILNRIPGNAVTYKSGDTVTNENDVVNYPVEFLNSMDVLGFPAHRLQLKIGVPIIMHRNIDTLRLCNGTRLAVKKLLNNVIEATILTGKYKSEDVLIPRIPMITTGMSFEFIRLQFPVRLAFAWTINKA